MRTIFFTLLLTSAFLPFFINGCYSEKNKDIEVKLKNYKNALMTLKDVDYLLIDYLDGNTMKINGTNLKKVISKLNDVKHFSCDNKLFKVADLYFYKNNKVEMLFINYYKGGIINYENLYLKLTIDPFEEFLTNTHIQIGVSGADH